MLIYLIALFIICLMFAVLRKSHKICLLISFVILTLIAALRDYSVGVDSTQYYNAYINIGNLGWGDYNSQRYQIGFFYLIKILNLISSSPQLLFIVTSVFINVSVYHFIKKYSSNYFLSTVLYVLMFMYFSNMNVMREALSIAVVLFGFGYLVRKKYIRYLICILIGSLFHTVAFVALLLLVGAMLPRSKWVYCILFILMVVLFVFYAEFFDVLASIFGYEGYKDSQFGVSNYFGSLLSFVENGVVIGILCFFAFAKRGFTTRITLEQTKKARTANVTLLAGVLWLLFLLLVVRMNIFNRLSGFYEIYAIVLIPELLGFVRKRSEQNYTILTIGIIVIYFAAFLIISIFRPEWYGCIPYKFFFMS